MSDKVGTFLGGCVNDPASIVDYAAKCGVPNHLNQEQLHTTILYSSVSLPADFKPIEQFSWIGIPLEFTKWNSQNDTVVLVCQYHNVAQYSRHTSLMIEHNLTYDHPVYNPHITLSYDVGDFDISHMNIRDFPVIEINCEFHQELNIDYLIN